MGTRDPRIDAYIAKSAAFARPILRRLRATVHEACPEVVETLKWSMPHFTHRGMLCGMAAFKGHCTFGFWKGVLVVPKADKNGDAMGQFGRITTLTDLPPKVVLRRYLNAAIRLNEAGVKLPARRRLPKRAVVVAPYFRTALNQNPKAKQAFATFSPSDRREYVEWIGEAKTQKTRDRRLATAIAWMADGKARNWKYARGRRA